MLVVMQVGIDIRVGSRDRVHQVPHWGDPVFYLLKTSWGMKSFSYHRWRGGAAKAPSREKEGQARQTTSIRFDVRGRSVSAVRH
jgi:hypothetical protein